MNRNVWNECSNWDANEGYLEGDWNQSHRNVTRFRGRSRSPIGRSGRGRRYEEFALPFHDFTTGRCVRGAIPEPQIDYQSTLQRLDFMEGSGNWGASNQHFHDYSASHGGLGDEIRETSHGRGFLDPSYGIGPEQRIIVKIPCKFHAQGRCRNGQNCRYLHDSAHQSEMGLSAPVATQNPGCLHDSAPQNQMGLSAPVAIHTSPHTFPRYCRENPSSQGTVRSGTRCKQFRDPRRNQCNKFPIEDSGSQEQIEPEEVASQQPPISSPIRTSAYSNNSDKGQSTPVTTGNLSVQTGPHPANLTAGTNSGQIAQCQEAIHQIHGASNSRDEYKKFQLEYHEMSPYKGLPLERFGSEAQNRPQAASQQSSFLSPIRIGADRSDKGQSTLATTGNLTGPHTASLTAEQNLDQIAESQEAIHGIRGAPTALFTTHIPNATASKPLNSQMHRNDFSVHPKRQGEFVDPQAGVNNPALSLQVQPVPLGTHALPDLSAQNGQNFNVSGQLLKNLAAAVHAEQSKAVIGIPKQSHMQNTQSLKPVGANVQTRQTLQESSVIPYSRSADMIAVPNYCHAATSEGAHIMNPYLGPFYGKACLTAAPGRSQSSQHSLNSIAMATSSAAPPSVQANQQEAIMIQPADSVSTGRHVAHMFLIGNGNPVYLSHPVALTGHAGNLMINPSEDNKGEPRGTDAGAKDNDVDKQNKAQKMFKTALAKFVKEELKPTWDSGQLRKELYKVIVQKVVEKVMSSEKRIPETKQNIDNYLSFCKKKIDKLIQDYIDKYTNVKFRQ